MNMDCFEEHKFWYGRHKLAVVLFDVAFENGDQSKIDAAMLQMEQCRSRMKACIPPEILKQRTEKELAEKLDSIKELKKLGML